MSDEQERAQRSAERAFPDVARFLGERHGTLPVYGPTDPHGDEDHTPEVIVRVDYALSREQVVTALGISFAEIAADRDPEALTVAEVRYEVEGFLAVQGIYELDRQMERDAQRTFPPEQQRVMQVLAEAVERAYPPRREPEPPAVQQPRYGDGTVTVETDDHGTITVDEPTWCVGHGDEPIGYRADVTHKGPSVTAEFEGVEFLPACISWAPFSELHPEPFPVADVDEFPPMSPAQLRELAAEVGLHAGRLYSKANELERLRREGSS
jgi:hypothetical protein